MGDKYYRLVCFVVNICPEPLRELFLKLAKKHAGSTYTTLDSYLAVRHRDVIQLRSKRKIRDDQYDLLYPGGGTADEKQWDVTLLVTLITEMFTASLQPLDIFIMKNEIREIRNTLQHYPNTSNMSDGDFDSFWRRLDTAVMSIAKQAYSTEQEESLRKKIANAKCNNLPNLGESLRLWYEEIIKQMENKLNEVESNTKETTSILRQVTVQKPGPSGDKNKRIKTADGILANLQASFESTMKDLLESFNEPEEVANIRTKLRDNHHVIVTGSYNSRYFEAALAAIKGMNYNTKRSVEMHISSDWRHIDPEDVDLVLCRNPFGSFSYDENKAKSMADMFNSMIHAAKGGEDKTLDIVMVTDLKILMECKEYHDHDILEEVVKVFDSTSETQPADLTFECRNQSMDSACLSVASNLSVMTDYFLKRYRVSSCQVDENVLREARDKFKSKKAIVVTGPRKCGKTSVAVALASSYEPSQCIRLTDPCDFKFIDFQNTCLLIIDEFAGKYRYEENDVYRWYTMFDDLYCAIVAGQMNAIITCERNKLEKCCNDISQHPVLDHRVVIPERRVVIKQEVVHQNTEYTYTEDNSNGVVTTGITMATGRKEISGLLAIPPIIPRLPLLDGPQSKVISPVRMPASMMSMPIDLSTGSSFPTRFLGNNFPEQVTYPRRRAKDELEAISIHRFCDECSTAPAMNPSLLWKLWPVCGSDMNELLSSTDDHPGAPRVTHTQTGIPCQLTGPHIWSVKDKYLSNIRVNGDNSICVINSSCILPSGEILLADFSNKRLKKLDDRYNVISVCVLPASPHNVCYIGNNVAVVSFSIRKLQFVDIRGGMTLTRSVDTDHDCSGLACHGDNLYVTYYSKVYLYNIDGVMQRLLYNHNSSGIRFPFFSKIALNDTGSIIYITGFDKGLVTIDSWGNYKHTFTDSEIFLTCEVCIDDEGHVLLSNNSGKILQLSSDGKQKLGIIANVSDYGDGKISKTLCFDRKNKALITAGISDNISILKLE